MVNKSCNFVSPRFVFTRWKGIVFFVLLLGVVLLGLQCSFEKPVAPKWDMKLPIPLINKAFTIDELVDKNDFLKLTPEGLLFLEVEEELDPYTIGDKLKVENISENFTSSLGNFKIDSPGSQQANITFVDIYPPIEALNGLTAPVPPFSYEDVEIDLPEFEDFQSVLIDTGTVIVTLHNRLPVPISEGLLVKIYNSATDVIIDSLYFDSAIPPGAADSTSLDLAGKRIPNTLKISLTGSSPGSGGNPVTLNVYEDGIDIEARISDIRAKEAVAKVPDQHFTSADTVALGDSILVTYAKIKEGQINLEITNTLPLGLNLHLILPDFTQSGASLEVNLPISKNQSILHTINLSGYEFQPIQSGDELKIRLSWEADVIGSGDQFVTLRAEDYIKLDVALPRLVFSEVHGILRSIEVTLDTLQKEIDLPEGIEGLQFDAARFTLIINSSINFPLGLNISVIGTNTKNGGSVEVSIVEQITDSDSIVLDETNSNIVELINLAPDELEVSGKVTLGDGVTEARITEDDSINVSVRIESPLSLTFPAQNLKTDVDTLEIDEDAQEEIRKRLISGKMRSYLENHFPFGAEVNLYFSAQDTNVFDNPELTIGPLVVSPGNTDPDSGRVQSSVSSEIEFSLTKEDLQVFANPEVYSGIRLEIPGGKVRVYKDDFILVRAKVEIVYHVDPEEMGNNE